VPTKHRIRVTVNGTVYEAEVEPRWTLVDFLRQELGLTGTHVGCEHGQCGVCTILFNGEPVRSCLLFAVQADGAELMTVEGLSTGEMLHPIQEAFIEAHGLQCGFCTPGILLVTHDLLRRKPDPTDAEIEEALSGQLCRCTGYQSIRRAVRLAAEKVQQARGGTSATELHREGAAEKGVQR